MRRSHLIVVAALVASLLAAGSARAAEARAKLKVVFPTTATTFELPHFVAQDLGWLAKAGIDVEELWVNGDANALRALVAGQGDIAAPGTFAAYSAIAEGAKIKAIASWQPLVDYMLVARADIGGLQGLAHARIASASLGSLTTELPKMVMKKHNVDPSGATFFSVGGHEARLQAVLAGKADAALVSALYATHGKRTGKVTVLADLAREYPGLGYIYLMADEKALADPARRATLRTYVRVAVIEASRFITTHPDEAIAVMRKRSPDLEPDVIKDVITQLNANKVWGVDGGLDPKVTEFTLPLALAMKSASRDITPAEVLDGSLVAESLAAH